MNSLRIAAVVVLCALALASGRVQAEQSQDFGDYVVHFNALTTNQLPPQAASAYNIQRSANRVLLTITVLKKVMGAPGTPVSAKVKAEAVNLTGHHHTIAMRTVEDDGAIYFLGTLNVDNAETYHFTINIGPEGIDETFVVKFRKQFFTD